MKSKLLVQIKSKGYDLRIAVDEVLVFSQEINELHNHVVQGVPPGIDVVDGPAIPGSRHKGPILLALS